MVAHGNDECVRPLPHFLTSIENSGAKRTTKARTSKIALIGRWKKIKPLPLLM
jgi:hypothetical protein